MALIYKVVSKNPGGFAEEGAKSYYPVLTDREPVNLEQLCNRITQRSTFTKPDVVGVIQSLIDLLPELLLDGKNIKIDGFGTFSIHASATGKQNPNEVSAEDISRLKLAFLPDKKIKKKLKGATFIKKKE